MTDSLSVQGDTVNAELIVPEDTLYASTERTLANLISTVTSPFFSVGNYFYGINPVTNRRQFRFLPQWFEVMAGKILYHATLGPNVSYYKADAITNIMNRLSEHTARPLPYQVRVVESPTVNAWCMPGGNMAVYTGIINKIDYYLDHKERLGLHGYTHPKTGAFISYKGLRREDVLAALMGHEMTHADARHSARQLERTWLVQITLLALTSFCAYKLMTWKQDLAKKSTTGELNSEALRSQKKQLDRYELLYALTAKRITSLCLWFYRLFQSRQCEYEADKYGLHLAVKAGFNPAGALFLQEVLHHNSLTPDSVAKAMSIVSTHPCCSDRKAELADEMISFMTHSPSACAAG